MTSLKQSEILIPFLRRWKIIVAAFVVCVAAAVAVTVIQTAQYSSTVQLFVSAQSGAGQNDILNAYEGGQFTTARVQSYVDLVKSPRVTVPVIRQLGLKISPSDLAEKLAATAPANTVLINIAATYPGAQTAQRIASATGRQLIRLVSSLESSPGQAAPVRVSVSSPATLPQSPVSPRRSLDIGLAAVLGLIIGFGAAQIIERIDDTVKSEDDLHRLLSVPLLASVPFDPSAPDGIDSLGGRDAALRVEAMRTLRTALRYMDVDSPPRCIVVTSCEPAAGKTVTSSSLAAVMADGGLRVALIEGDMRRPRLRSYVNSAGTGDGLADVLGSDLDVADVLRVVPRAAALSNSAELSFLSSGSFVPNPSEILGSRRMSEVIERLKASFDIVIIDAPPILPVTDAAVLSRLSDGVIFIVEYGRTSRRDVQRAFDLLAQVGARVLGLVANKTPAELRYAYDYSYEGDPSPTLHGVKSHGVKVDKRGPDAGPPPVSA